ncbi:chromate efflux transporter [Acidisoma sp. C75]
MPEEPEHLPDGVPPPAEPRAADPPLSILLVFLRLGCTSFGGPIAHLGYFRAEFVTRRRWLSESAYGDLVALAQFLPGPASSQTGFGIGLLRGGLIGGLAAWLGFTLPSALLMILFAYGAGSLTRSAAGLGLLHGLKLAAVAIVAQAVLGMARSLCPDRARASIALLALGLTVLIPWPALQIGLILAGGLAGRLFCRAPPQVLGGDVSPPVSRRFAGFCLGLFATLLALSFLPARAGALALFEAIYRAGALVFGGGHVVLPLLHDAVVNSGWVTNDAFLAGYGFAQAVPGPLFTFAAYLGAIAGHGGAAGACLALVAIFLPGLLCLLGALPFWHAIRARPGARAMMQGTNAAVVGLLGAALYNPVWTSAVRAPADFAVAAAGFVLLVAWQAPPLLVVSCSALAGLGLALG